MTDKLSQADAKLGMPDACPKCGAVFVPGVQYRSQHFVSAHRDAIGQATFTRDPSFSGQFVYVRPVPYVVGIQWYIVWLDHPYQVVKIAPAEWSIVWAGPDPAEGDR